MNQKAAQKESATIDNDTGDVINFDFPETVTIPGAADCAVLEKKHKKLAKINPDSKTEYTALKAAIKEVGEARRYITTKEDEVKDPLNKFRTKLIAKAKELRAPFEKLEKSLKAEQKRVDDIVAERLAAQKMRWEINVAAIRELANQSINFPAADLPAHLIALEAMELDEDEYGDLLPDAEQYRARAIQIAEEGIATEKERVRIAEESARLEEARRHDEAMKASREMDAAHNEALAMNETHDLQVKMAAMEAAQTPAPMVPLAKQIAENNGSAISSSAMEKISDSDFSKVMMGGGRGGGKMPEIAKSVTAASLSDFDDDDDLPLTDNEQDDFGNMNDFIEVLKNAAKVAPGNFHDDRFNMASGRVAKSLNDACDYLQRVIDGDPA